MKNLFKRVTTFVLSICMIVTMLPEMALTARAEDAPIEPVPVWKSKDGRLRTYTENVSLEYGTNGDLYYKLTYHVPEDERSHAATRGLTLSVVKEGHLPQEGSQDKKLLLYTERSTMNLSDPNRVVVFDGEGKGFDPTGNEDMDLFIDGKLVANIKAKSIDLKDAEVADISSNDYTGSPVKPEVVVKYEGMNLKEGVDYEVEYINGDVSASEFVDAGEYTVVIKGINGFSGNVSKTFVINKIKAEVSIENWTYGDEPKTPVVSGNPDPEHVKFEYKAEDAEDSEYSENVPVNAGVYVLRATVDINSKNYKAGSSTTEFSIGMKLIDKPILPQGKKDLEYNGKDQVLVDDPADVSGGDWYYAVLDDPDKAKPDDEDYSADLPTGKDAKTYRVFYKYVTDKNHYSNMQDPKRPLLVKISQAGYDYEIDISNWNFGENASAATLKSNPEDADVTFYFKKASDDDTEYKEYIPGKAPYFPWGVGKYTLKAVIGATDNYIDAEVTKDFEVRPKTLTKDMIVFDKQEILVYGEIPEGKIYRPDYAIMSGKTKLVEDQDYLVSPGSDVAASVPGTYELHIVGIGNFKGSLDVTWKITQMENSGEEGDVFSHSVVEPLTYTGDKLTPEPVIAWNETVLKKDEDYTLSYKNNVNAGSKTASKKNKRPQIIVKGKGQYQGSITIYFDILPRSINATEGIFAPYMEATAADKPYTGKTNKSKPVIKYTNESGKVITLKENKDYKVTYDPATPKEAGTVKVIVEGKKNYTGTACTSYKILPGGTDYKKAVVEKIADQPYRGTPYTADDIKALVVVKTSDKKDAAVVDPDEYIVSVSPAGPVNAGKVTVTVHGIMHSELWKTVSFNIVPKEVKEEDLALEFDESFTYTGKAIKPEIKITDKATGSVLSAKDYTVTYANNTKVAGKDAVNNKKKSIAPALTVKFKGNYKGSFTEKFEIVAKELTASDVSIEQAAVKDNGKITAASLRPVVKFGDVTLKNNTDYTVSFTPVEGKDMQTATVTFMGNYTGSADFTFHMYKASTDITDEKSDIFVDITAIPVIYTGDKITVAVSLRDTIDGEYVYLEEGKDYTVSYKNNINVAKSNAKKAPSVTVTGKGAYKGSITEKFTIEPMELTADKFEIIAEDAKYTGKAVTPKVTVKNKETGKVLKKGTDYDLEYRYNVEITEKDPAVVVVKGKGNYCYSEKDNLESDPLAYFRIYKTDVNSLYVDGVNKNETFTGSQIRPEIKVYSDKKKKNLVDPSNYEVIYGENTKTGKGTVTIVGKERTDFGGKKEIKFNILPKSLKWLVDLTK